MNQKVRIRDYEETDFAGIATVWEETHLGGTERGDDAAAIRRTIEVGGRFLVMEEIKTGRIIGTSWLTWDGRRTYLHHFGILPSLQRKHLGSLLAKESLRIAKELGTQIKLEVHRDNLAAINLYRKFGFKYLGDYDVYIIRDIF